MYEVLGYFFVKYKQVLSPFFSGAFLLNFEEFLGCYFDSRIENSLHCDVKLRRHDRQAL